MTNRFYYTLVLCCFFTLTVSAQVLDDSTKQVYGYHSTSYFTEQDVLKDDTLTTTPDSSFDATIHRYDKLYFKDNIYQNLGNLGTASKAIFWNQPTAIGYTFGYHTYDQYASNVSETKYYDTKSPYSILKYVQGGTGENSLNFDYTRNFSKLLNVGMQVQRLTSVKQIGRKVQRDRNVDLWDFGFNAAFHSPSKRYIALASYARFVNLVKETGGIIPDSVNFDQTNLNKYDESPVKMSDSARTSDDRTNFRFYNQFSIVPKNTLNLFYAYQFSDQYVGFNDKNLNNTLSGKTLYKEYVYPAYNIDSLRTVYRAQFIANTHTIGLKSAYRSFKMSAFTVFEGNQYKQIVKSDSSQKLLMSVVKVGGTLDYLLNDNAKFSLSAMNQLTLKAIEENKANAINVNNNKDFNVNIAYSARFVKAGYGIAKYSPTLQQTQYAANNYGWENDSLKPIHAQTYYINFFKTIHQQRFELALSHTEVTNYVYFVDTAQLTQHWREQIIVKQDTAKGFNLTNISVLADFKLGEHFFIKNQLRYTLSAGDVKYRSFRVPTWYASTLMYYQYRFTKDLGLQIGIDVHYRSAYKADAYSVALQQFVVQNTFETKAYTVVDAFVNLKIKRATVWVKGSQMNQFMGQEVYFLTPYYPGMKMAFHFGVNWPFFD
ncbi:MAG: hypothetical protein RL060_1244, partial [Bacteroidota bacterium]